MHLLNSGGSILASFPLGNPAGTVAGSVLTFNPGLTDPSAAGNGTAVAATFEDSGGTTVISGITVGIAGADLILTPTNIIAAGNVIVIATAAITGN